MATPTTEAKSYANKTTKVTAVVFLLFLGSLVGWLNFSTQCSII